MIRQVCVLTKSYKNGGYCVAGIDLATKKIVRLVNSQDPAYDFIKKEQLIIDNYEIKCFDVIEVDFLLDIPQGCQIENCLVNQNTPFKTINTFSEEETFKLLDKDNDDNFMINKNYYLDENEIKNVNKSLFIYIVKNFKVEASIVEEYGDLRYRYKCSFDYKNERYIDMSLTDPEYRDIEKNNMVLDNAIVVASLPHVPYNNGLYYKFIAKVVPINEKVINNNYIEIKKEGFFYGVSGNDALLINKIFGYKIYGNNIKRTGFSLKVKESVLNKLDELCINYRVYNYSSNPSVEKSFENNNYEIIDASTYVPNDKKLNYLYYDMKKSEYLKNLALGINPNTGEYVGMVDDKITTFLLDVAKTIAKKEGAKNGFKLKPIDDIEAYIEELDKEIQNKSVNESGVGKRWTIEEDNQLIEEYKQGLSIKEISHIHKRKSGGIRARLKGKGILV